MPLHLPALGRREFLRSTVLGAAALTVPALAAATSDSDETLVAILNDTHIGEKQGLASPHPTRLAQTVKYLVSLPKKPVAVVINGDLAMRDGQPGDYRLLRTLLQPLRDAGLNLHLTLGNHDERDVFYSVLTSEMPGQPLVLSRHVAVVPTARANLFLLDSLLRVMIGPGDLGRQQIEWLARALDANADKPAVIVAHHNPRFGGDPRHYPNGLEDGGELWDVLQPRQQVKAYVHGHIHSWSLASHRNIHIINTPACGYVGNPNVATTGWTMARFSSTGVKLTLMTHEPDHPWNNLATELVWRS